MALAAAAWNFTRRQRRRSGRDGELASQGGGAHAAAGTLVVRLSDVLSARERQALMAKVLDALTTSEPGETVERAEQTQSLSELLTVRETGFAVEDGRLYYALVLANDMAGHHGGVPARARVLL